MVLMNLFKRNNKKVFLNSINLLYVQIKSDRVSKTRLYIHKQFLKFMISLNYYTSGFQWYGVIICLYPLFDLLHNLVKIIF